MKNVAPKISADRGPHGWIGTETVETPFGNFAFDKGYPTAETAQRLEELQIFNRAIEVYLSQIPAVSMFHLRKGLQDFAAKSRTNGVLLGLRGFLVNGKPDKAVASMKAIKVYPVGRPSPRTMSFLNGSGEMMDTLFPDNYEFFKSLAQLIDQEPADAVS